MTAAAAAPTAGRSRFLDLRALSALAHMRFVTRQQIEGGYSGRHRSKQQGGAAEFVDYREYAPGEDLRRLDWKVLARTEPAVRPALPGRDEPHLHARRSTPAARCSSAATAAARQVGRARSSSTPSTSRPACRHVISRPAGPGRPGHHRRRPARRASRRAARRATSLRLQSADREPEDRAGHRPGQGPARPVRPPAPPRRADRDERLPRGRPGGDVRVASGCSSTAGGRWSLLHLIHPDEERLPEGTAFRFEGLENDGRVDCSPGRHPPAVPGALRRPRRDRPPTGAGGGVRLPARFDGVPYLQTLSGFLVERSG